MNNKEYLDQIASEARKTSAPSMKLFGLDLTPKTIKILIGAAVAIFVVFIIGIIVSGSGSNNSERDYVDQLNLRTTNLMSTIDTYNKSLKSSELRSYGSSLKAVLVDTNYGITTSLTSEFGVSSTSKPDKDQTKTTEDAILADLTESLENARLNGLLDRAYSREMTYQIGMLLSLESETLSHTKKSTLTSILVNSMENLDQLYSNFSNFVAN